MTNDREDFLAYATQLRAEHRRLQDRLSRIEREWFPRQGDRFSTVDLPRMIEELETLCAELTHHFDEEESGGCLEEAVSREPSLGPEATRLENEHPELLGKLNGLIEKLRAASRPDGSADNPEEDFQHFANQLRAHEAAENRVLAKGFGVEDE